MSDPGKPPQDESFGDKAADVADGAVDAASSGCFVTDLFDFDFCYVATAAHGDFNAPEVVVLRAYRDARLMTNPLGRAFTRAYYATGPFGAALITRFPALRPPARRVLAPLVWWARRSISR